MKNHKSAAQLQTMIPFTLESASRQSSSKRIRRPNKMTIDARRLSTGSSEGFGLRTNKKHSKSILKSAGYNWEAINTSKSFPVVLIIGTEVIPTSIRFSLFADGKSLKGEICVGSLPSFRRLVKAHFLRNPKNTFEALWQWQKDKLVINITDKGFLI